MKNLTDLTEEEKQSAVDGIFESLQIASLFHVAVLCKHNSSDDRDWLVITAFMQDSTKLGWMFEDCYWEVESR